MKLVQKRLIIGNLLLSVTIVRKNKMMFPVRSLDNEAYSGRPLQTKISDSCPWISRKKAQSHRCCCEVSELSLVLMKLLYFVVTTIPIIWAFMLSKLSLYSLNAPVWLGLGWYKFKHELLLEPLNILWLLIAVTSKSSWIKCGLYGFMQPILTVEL